FAKETLRFGSPRQALQLQRFSVSQDVRAYLPRIKARALFVSRRDCNFIPTAQGRYLADRISGARFIELPGSDLWMFWEAPDAIIDHVQEFLTGKSPRKLVERAMRAILFTDIIGSTQRAAALGDGAWRALLDRHDELIKKKAAYFDGTFVDSTGDGML